eukprot:3008507-Rhodomonas_salina.1
MRSRAGQRQRRLLPVRARVLVWPHFLNLFVRKGCARTASFWDRGRSWMVVTRVRLGPHDPFNVPRGVLWSQHTSRTSWCGMQTAYKPSTRS